MTLTPQTARELVEAAKAAELIVTRAAYRKKIYVHPVVLKTIRTALSQAEKEMEGGG